MSECYFDRYLIHNSSLACFLLANFVSEYESQASPYPIDLPKLLLVLPLVWNESNRVALGKRNAASSLEAVLRGTPVLKVDLELRVRAHVATTLQGLNLAVSSGLVGREVGDGGAEHFTKLLARWPRGIKSTLPSDFMRATKQLAMWYSTASTETLYKLLFGIPNEIRH